jgi:hypothetical protein
MPRSFNCQRPRHSVRAGDSCGPGAALQESNRRPYPYGAARQPERRWPRTKEVFALMAVRGPALLDDRRAWSDES